MTRYSLEVSRELDRQVTEKVKNRKEPKGFLKQSIKTIQGASLRSKAEHIVEATQKKSISESLSRHEEMMEALLSKAQDKLLAKDDSVIDTYMDKVVDSEQPDREEDGEEIGE